MTLINGVIEGTPAEILEYQRLQAATIVTPTNKQLTSSIDHNTAEWKFICDGCRFKGDWNTCTAGRVAKPKADGTGFTCEFKEEAIYTNDNSSQITSFCVGCKHKAGVLGTDWKLCTVNYEPILGTDGKYYCEHRENVPA